MIKGGSVANQTTCLIDFLATCSEITGNKLAENAREDSYSLLPILFNPNTKEYARETTVHHSLNGILAIRKGDWKLILCPDSGGWSEPTPAKSKKMNLPPFQLYNLKTDPSETTNPYGSHPEVVKELKEQLVKEIYAGRSTPGLPQQNDGGNDWKQLDWTNQK